MGRSTTKKLRFIIIILFSSLVTSCQLFFEQPVSLADKPILYDKVTVTISPQIDFNDKKVQGMYMPRTESDGSRHCHILLRDYPRYLGHEMDHCFRDLWHGTEPNGDDFK